MNERVRDVKRQRESASGRESKAAIEMDMYIILNKNTYLLCKYLSPCQWSDTVLAALFEGLMEGKREKGQKGQL